MKHLLELIEHLEARGIALVSRNDQRSAAKRMTESAGFDPVTVSWVPISGGRVVTSLYRLLGVDEIDITIGHKPNRTVETPPEHARRVGAS